MRLRDDGSLKDDDGSVVCGWIGRGIQSKMPIWFGEGSDPYCKGPPERAPVSFGSSKSRGTLHGGVFAGQIIASSNEVTVNSVGKYHNGP